MGPRSDGCSVYRKKLSQPGGICAFNAVLRKPCKNKVVILAKYLVATVA